MKKTNLVMLLFACTSVYAELPPVIDHSSYPPSSAAPVNPTNAPSTNTLYELMGRLEQLQAEVQQLTGKVDEQAYRIDELKKHQTKMYSDFDERLQGIENKANGTGESIVESPSEKAGTGDEATKESESLAPAPESVPAKEAASVDKAESANESAPADKPGDNQAPKPKPDTGQVSGPEKQEYQQAYNELRNGHTNQSIEQFKAYLIKYPTGVYANNAQYWLGEAYRVNQDNDAARKAFNDVIEKYSDAPKVPDALLKLGYIEIDQNNMAKAREYLTRVITDYPKSPAALLASKKLLKLDEVKN
jgi:tol-pal system protein YbgF